MNPRKFEFVAEIVHEQGRVFVVNVALYLPKFFITGSLKGRFVNFVAKLFRCDVSRFNSTS